MSVFELYLRLGIDHILDFQGYDHILFIMTLCAVYRVKEWKKVLVLITAFTLGHSTTLVLASLKLISIDTGLIEFLIPLTIFITALANAIYRYEKAGRMLHLIKYLAALFFGLIHGLGFSLYLRSLLGSAESIVLPLFSFNLGIEIGQIMIVVFIMLVTWIIVNLFKSPRREWNLVLSGVALGISFLLMMERIP
ncbi:MAG: HupE/UreJ family protein [Bacteroidales bacterium]|nr:HupE/UreJ family protein [Bacteroidales bacterium]